MYLFRLSVNIFCAKKTIHPFICVYIYSVFLKKERIVPLKVVVLQKIQGMNMLLKHIVKLLLTCFLLIPVLRAQPVNDGCNNALSLCPSQVVQTTNANATVTFCPDCEDDFNFCFQTQNSVWFKFYTNVTGGDATVRISNLLFNLDPIFGQFLQATILSSTVNCNASSYTPIGNCEDTIVSTTLLQAFGLPPNSAYYVVITGALSGGASKPAEANFSIEAFGSGVDRPAPVVAILPPPGVVCPGQSSYFIANLDNCADTSSFRWFLNGGLIAVTSEANMQTSSIENGDTVTVECSCFLTCTVHLEDDYGPIAVDPITVDAGADQFVILDEPVTLKATTTNAFQVSWSPPEELSTPFKLETIAYPKKSTIYTITASNADCSVTDDVYISMEEEFIIPGSFSPNGDGTNDTWIIQGIDAYPNAHVTIYDRWGQIVSDLVSYSSFKAWDGTNKGKPLTNTTYFYVIELNNGVEQAPMKGMVTIIR